MFGERRGRATQAARATAGRGLYQCSSPSSAHIQGCLSQGHLACSELRPSPQRCSAAASCGSRRALSTLISRRRGTCSTHVPARRAARCGVLALADGRQGPQAHTMPVPQQRLARRRHRWRWWLLTRLQVLNSDQAASALGDNGCLDAMRSHAACLAPLQQLWARHVLGAHAASRAYERNKPRTINKSKIPCTQWRLSAGFCRPRCRRTAHLRAAATSLRPVHSPPATTPQLDNYRCNSVSKWG